MPREGGSELRGVAALDRSLPGLSEGPDIELPPIPHEQAVDGERMAERVQTHGCRPAPACPGAAPTRQGPGGHLVVERATALRHEDVLAETNRSAPVYGSFRAGRSWS